MPNRKEVYAAIESERAYQEARWGKTETKGLHSITEFIAYMEDYQLEAKHILARTKKVDAYPQAIEIMRKIVAMGVNCMEQHGAPYRPCTIPPEGWYCTRGFGHEGPCAAWPKEK